MSDKAPPSKSKADLALDHIIASDTQRVAAWADALVLAIEGHRAHPRSDPALHKLDADLEASTRSCLGQIGDFTIRVEELDLFFGGSCIYHSTAAAGSLAAVLFRDGLRELTIREGLEPDELVALVDILQCATGECDQDSEGVVTLLWERNFRHIDHVCVPFEEWEPELPPEGDLVATGAPSDGMPWPAGGQEAGSGGQAEERADDWSLSVRDTSPLAGVRDVPHQFTEIEVNNLLMVAKIEEGVSPRERVLEIVAAILAAEENPAAYLEVASIIGRLAESAVRAGDMEGANQLVDRLRSISKTKTTAPSDFRAATDQVLQDIGRSDSLESLGTTLNRNRAIDLGALTSFLAQLGPSAAPTLCDLLGEIGEKKARRSICEALTISCRNDVNLLIERLSDPRWFVVRNILYILGRIAHQGVERALGDALYHSDPRVRREAVRAMGEIKTPTSRAYLNSALRDPDKIVRMIVAGALAERHNERAARIIWGVIQAPEFSGRDADERRAFFEALGTTGSDALVPQIEQALTRGGLFQSRNHEGRAEAAMALAWLGTPAALAILKREAGSKNGAVRRAVTETLETVRKIPSKKQHAGWEGEGPVGGK